MLGLFGKKKLKEKDVAKVFVGTLNDISINGYESIADFIANDPQLDNKPTLTKSNLEWFVFIVFTANLRHLKDYFGSDQLDRLRIEIIDEFSISFEDRNPDQILEQVNNYEDFLKGIPSNGNLANLISKAIYLKFGLDEFQNQKGLEENYQLINTLSQLTEHFVWNWSDFLEKYKMVS